MRIGIYDPYLDSLSGGEKYMLMAASCLSSANEVTVFWDDENIKAGAQSKLNVDLSGIKIKKNIFSSNFKFYKRVMESRKYDLLFILSDGSLPLNLTGRTIIHFQFPVEWVNGNDISTKIKLSKINQIICNSYFTKSFIDRKFKINSKILYPPCISSEYLSDISVGKIKVAKKNIVLTVGRYSPLPEGGSIKKFEVMIKAFKKMIDEGLQNWHFVLVISALKENEKYINELKKAINNYPVKIIANCSYRELDQLYSDSKIYWHAAGFNEDLQKQPERAEHFGITTVEAMAHKVVPVVISAGGQQEIVDDNTNGFLWETEEELMKKTKQLMIDEILRDQMANLAIIKVRQFTNEKFCENLKQLLK